MFVCIYVCLYVAKKHPCSLNGWQAHATKLTSCHSKTGKKIYFITNKILIFLENQTSVNWITCDVNSIRSVEQCAEQIIYLLCALPALLFQLWFHLFRKKSSNPTKTLSLDNLLFSEKVIGWLRYEIGLLWKAAHSLNSFPNRHIICEVCWEKSHCNHRICGFVFISCHFACLPACPTTGSSEIYAMEHNPGSQFHIEYAPLIWIYSNGHCEWNSLQIEYACWLY